MALDWKPHSNPPPDRLATVLVAYAPELGVDNGYVGRMYEVRFGVIRRVSSSMSSLLII